jgi:hypothetical protein
VRWVVCQSKSNGLSLSLSLRSRGTCELQMKFGILQSAL